MSLSAGTKEARQHRYRMFALEYISNGRNAAAAAKTVGYSESVAKLMSRKILKRPEVQAIINEFMQKQVAKSNLTAERVLQEMERLCFSDGRKLLNADGTLKRVNEWDDDTAAAVASLKITEEYEGKGKTRERVGTTKDIKFWDKGNALNMAAKHLGLFERDNAQRAPNLALQVVAMGPE
jgi:phage terminase small subunit